MIFCSPVYRSPLGGITAASDGENLVGLWLEGQRYFCGTLSEPPVLKADLPVFLQTILWLDRYFSGEKPQPSDLPLCPSGSLFRRTVWRCLCEIPYGETVTYGAVAQKAATLLGRERLSAQAVGGAVGHNPISLIIPCHRVIGADGSLTGYAGGLDKKRWLLQWEKTGISSAFSHSWSEA